MIQAFVEAFESGKDGLRKILAAAHVENYAALVKVVVTAIGGDLDPERIHEINDGDYQGTLVYVIAEQGYQPSKYWYVKIYYGSCSGCDTLEGIRSYGDEPPEPKRIDDYMGLALNIVQGLKEMGDNV